MKNLIYLLAFLPVVMFAQIPNAGFENWSGPSGSETPDEWDVIVFSSGYLLKSTDRQEGDFSVLLSNGSLSSNAFIHTTFPVNAMYNKLTGYLKVDSIELGGRAYIKVSAWTGGTLQTIGEFQHYEPTDEFIFFEIPLTLPPETIDSMRIRVESGPATIPDGIVLGFSAFKLDALKLIDSTTAIINIEQSDLIEIYPNPASNVFQIKSVISGLKKVTVYDLKGRAILQKETSNLIQDISISHLMNGIYIVLIEAADGRIFRQQLIKVR